MQLRGMKDEGNKAARRHKRVVLCGASLIVIDKKTPFQGQDGQIQPTAENIAVAVAESKQTQTSSSAPGPRRR
jgi:hypothetical protein